MYILAIVLVLIFAASVWFARKSIFGWMNSTNDIVGEGFTLSDLRELHKRGAMTDEEFERAKSQIVQSVQAAAARKAAPTPEKKPPAA